ncbi:MAG: heme lyase CcmF/NrfE family subunit [Planctomycetes bacterium]|nr:heme lyase CcmF/NrfE family subunit [Planctomycetota bacterium]
MRFDSPGYLRAARWSIGIFALLMTLASAALLTALLRSDFRFEYVAGYTERALPVGYKFAAFWAGQEGSLLLWAWMLAVMATIALPGLRRLNPVEHAGAVAVLALVCGFFAALMLFAANPFVMTDGPAVADGRGLNPMLQDPGMIIHPPVLFLGYAGFTVPFAVLVGVLIANRHANHWIAVTRRWLLASWLFLTAGIVIGCWWAYIELGWGGYWAWDPVENASLLPWLTSTALLHSMMVHQHRGMFKVWTAVLIALSFILCIFGSYLTRSGVISSVHAFAPSLIGTFFLVFLVVLVAGTAGLLLWRRRALAPEHQLEGLISREGAFLLGNVLLLLMMATTLVGTIFPLISGVFVDEAITVGPPFYNRVVAPMGVLLVAVMALGPVLAFGRSAAGKIAQSLRGPATGAAIVTAIVAFSGTHSVWALVCVAITALGTFAVIVDFTRTVSARRRSTGETWPTASARLIDRDHRRYGGRLAHLGLMMAVIGIAGSSLFSTDDLFRLKPGETTRVGPYSMTFAGLEQLRMANYTAFEATVNLTDNRGRTVTLRPQCRFYDTWSEKPNTEVAIRSTLRHDLYVSVVGWENLGAITAIEVRINPLVMWIWIGGFVAGLGGLFCMLPRLLPDHHRAPVVESGRASRPKTLPAAATPVRTARLRAERST